MPEPARDLKVVAQRLMPWWPEALLDIYVQRWTETGDPDLALGMIRATPQYNEHFPGNRRPDGSIRLDEQSYLAHIEGFRLDLEHYGLNANLFQPRFAELIEHGVTPAMLARRLTAVHSEIWQNLDSIRQVYAQYYGRGDLTAQSIFAMAIDPQISQDVMARRITAAQIGGHAARFGFQRAMERAEEMAAAGLTGEQAGEFFSQAAQHLPRLDAWARRFADPMGEQVGIGGLEAAAVFGDPAQTQRVRRLEASERAVFSPHGQVREDEVGTRGLRPR